jgi:hypothetical protein
MMRDKVAKLVVMIFAFALNLVINLGIAKLIQYTIECTFDRRAPLALVFACLVLVPWATRERKLNTP